MNLRDRHGANSLTEENLTDKPAKRNRAIGPLYLLPNLMTLGAICAGMTSMRAAFDGDVVLSMSLIVLAAVLDGLDGMMARLLSSESAIGAELDSLADFLNFGVAPGVLLYLWALQESRSVGWIAVLIFGICCALRLARYNVMSRAAAPGTPRKTFSGVPAPGGALLVLMPLVLSRIFPEMKSTGLTLFTGFWLCAVGLMMISRVPTPSLKMFRISRDKAAYLMVALIAFVAAFFTWPWLVVLATELAYLALLARFAFRPPALETDDTKT